MVPPWNRRGLIVRIVNELGPALLFFVVLRLTDVYWATGVLIVSTVMVTTLSWCRERRVPLVPTATLAATVILGLLTLAFDDPQFIKVRPTLLNLAGAIALAGALVAGRLPLRHALNGGIALPEATWRSLTWALIVFLVGLAALNEAVWRNTDTETWAAFKAFAVPALNGLFALGAWRYARSRPGAAAAGEA